VTSYPNILKLLYVMEPQCYISRPDRRRAYKERGVFQTTYDMPKWSTDMRHVTLMLRAVIVFFVIILLLPGISQAAPVEVALDQLVEQMTSGISGQDKRKIAIVDFCDLKGRVTKAGAFFAEEILVRLAKKGDIGIVERKYLQKALTELQFKGSGIVDVGSAQKLGKLLGADGICIGTVMPFRSFLKINARLIDVDTGRIFAAASVDVDRNPDIDSLFDEGEEGISPLDSVKKPKPKYKKGNLIANGGFTRSYEGWKRSIGDIAKGYSQAEIISFSHGKSGKALHVKHKGEGHIQFSQAVSVPGPDLVFSASFQGHSHEGSMIGFSGSGVVQVGIMYFDEGGNKLGGTILVNYVKNPFADTPLIGVPRRADDTYKTHYVEFKKDSFLQDYRINIRQEIESNLMGIDPDSLRQVAIILWCGASHHQAGAELWVTDIKLAAKR